MTTEKPEALRIVESLRKDTKEAADGFVLLTPSEATKAADTIERLHTEVQRLSAPPQLVEKTPPVKNPMAEWPWKSSAPEASGDAEAKNPDVGRDEFLRAAGRQQAWLDLMCRFDAKQRRHVANLLAHSWTLQAIEIRGHYGEEVERIEADLSHENAVAALKEQRAARVELRGKKAVELLESITERVNAHDRLLALLREAEPFLRVLGLDSSPAASLAHDMRVAISEAAGSES